MKKRTFLLSAASVSGALLVGWGAAPPRSRKGSPALMLPKDGEVALSGWIKVAPDGSVVLAMPRSEMGQGIHTALAMMVAEELELPLERVRTQQAGADSIYGNVAMFVGGLPFHPKDGEPGHRTTAVKVGEWMVAKLAREMGINATGGSSSVADAWDVIRPAAAVARGQLLGAASLKWKLPVEELTLALGVVAHPSGKSAHFGELAGHAANTPPATNAVKLAKYWTLMGTPAPRQDVPAKVFGQATFGIDTRLPGMLYATVRMAPALGGAPARFDPGPALAKPGVLRVINLPPYAGQTAGLAVVGATYWHAQQGAQALEVSWQGRAAGNFDTRMAMKTLQNAAETKAGFEFHRRGNVPADLLPARPRAAISANSATTAGDAAVAKGSIGAATGARTVHAAYTAPYLAHATLEPMNCTAQVQGDRVEIWAPTQVPQVAAQAAARVAGVPLANVKVNVTLLGGGFGRRLEVDFVCQAVRVAMECGGKPVQLLWSREEDTTHDFYRPAHAAVLAASINADNMVTTLAIRAAGDAISPRWFERGVMILASPIDTPDKTAAEGLFDMPYGFENQSMSQVATQIGIPVGFWRSVGHSHNAFFSEGFIDELALETQTDAVEFRRKYLVDAPRHLAVLNLAAAKAGWGLPMVVGMGRGIALHESFGSIVAQVVEISIEVGVPKVHRVVCAIDCGQAVNPSIIAQQMESSVVFALTAALHGSIDVEAGEVKQRNFDGYPMVKLASAPLVQTFIVASDRPPTGVGEPAVPPLAPALASAIRALTGRRLRNMPFAPQTS